MTYALSRRARAERDQAMSDILNEQLSALLDGELPPDVLSKVRALPQVQQAKPLRF